MSVARDAFLMVLTVMVFALAVACMRCHGPVALAWLTSRRKVDTGSRSSTERVDVRQIDSDSSQPRSRRLGHTTSATLPKTPTPQLGPDVRQLLAQADGVATACGSAVVGDDHLLLALAEANDEVGQTLAALGADAQALRSHLPLAQPHATRPAVPRGFSTAASDAVDRAVRAAAERGDTEVRREHILFGLTSQPASLAAQALASLGLDPGRLHRTIQLGWSGPAVA